MKRKVKLYRGTNIDSGRDFLRGRFSDISWWTDNYETVEHYYEGCVNEITVVIDDSLEDDYISEMDEMMIPLSAYTYGVLKPEYPINATWYSFSFSYLSRNVKSVRVVSLDKVMDILN